VKKSIENVINSISKAILELIPKLLGDLASKLNPKDLLGL
jgi:hypothetical protein